MTEKSKTIRKHHEASKKDSALVVSFKQLLQKMGDGPLTSAQLAGLDQFQGGGLEMTSNFIKLLKIAKEMQVLDAGSGLGGPSRFAAEHYGCQVMGVDLVSSFVAVAQLLAERVGMSRNVSYQVGNLMGLDLPDEHFDVVYTQHVVMNIPDRTRVYSELRRVLKPGGTFGFYDALATDGKPAPHYPVPWAEHGNQSALLTEAETRDVLKRVGLRVTMWKDVTSEVIQWADVRQLLAPQGATPGPNLKLVMGERLGQMSTNFERNLREEKVRLVMATTTRS
jgi:ubiquinone/menaquinone biosynthesis C-methylase UbiE